MGNNAVQVLEEQIAELQKAIEKNQCEVGGLFLKIYSRRVLSDSNVDNMMETFKQMDKMPPLIAKHEKYLTELETLQKSKAKIEEAETGILVKQ